MGVGVSRLFASRADCVPLWSCARVVVAGCGRATVHNSSGKLAFRCALGCSQPALHNLWLELVVSRSNWLRDARVLYCLAF